MFSDCCKEISMSPTTTAYFALALAIVGEIVGTTFLQRSQQFTRLGDTLIMAGAYAGAFFCLSHALKLLPLGVAYALWCGFGIILTALIGLFVFRQSLDLPAVAGIGMILAGVVTIQAFSRSAGH
jgi:small multidrug resistance pump